MNVSSRPECEFERTKTEEKEIILLWKKWNYADMLAYVEMYSNKYWDFKEKVLPEVLKNCLIMAYSASPAGNSGWYGRY